MSVAKLASLIKALFRKSREEDDLSEELQFHLRNETKKNVTAGMTSEEALYAALRTFGGVDQVTEQCRDVRGTRFLDELWQDVRYGLRTLLNNPGFSAVAAVSVALGIGANVAIFSLMDAILWRALPVKDPQQLVTVAAAREEGRPRGVPFSMFRALQNGNDLFSGMLTTSSDGLSLGTDGQAERVIGEVVSSNYFSVLGVKAFVGRTFSELDEQSPWVPVAVLSYDFWKRRFGGNASVVGQTVRLNGYPFTVIGVSPAGFFGLEVGGSPEVRIPMLVKGERLEALPQLNSSEFVGVTARLRDGVSLEQARSATDVLYQQFLQANPQVSSIPRYQASHIQLFSAAKGNSHLRNSLKQPLFTLLAVVGLVLLIACANVANLLLARASTRRREIALRLALGASRGRLLRQLLTESLLLSFSGGILGLFLASWSARVLLTLLPQNYLPPMLALHPDSRILLFALVVTLLTGMLFGLAPALHTTRPSATPALKNEITIVGGNVRRLELRKALIVLQMALSLLLLIGAGLFLRSLANLKGPDTEIHPEKVLLFSMKHVIERYTPQQIMSFYADLVQRIEALPSVRSASVVNGGPLSGPMGTTAVSIQGQASAPVASTDASVDNIGPKFFETLGMPLLAGRDFSFGDLISARKVAIVNQALAENLFRKESPLGKRIAIGRSTRILDLEIVGIVQNSRYTNLRDPAQRMVYLPFKSPSGFNIYTLYVRTTGNPDRLIPAIRQEFYSLDKDLPVFNVKTFTKHVSDSLAQERLITILSTIFGSLALLLASIGLYGVMAYGVARRTREIGIRMALGAQRRNVLWMILKEALLLVSIGIAIGIPAALATSRFVANQLFGVAPTDVLTTAVAMTVLATVGLFASYLPARRATQVEPMVALRYE